MGDKVEKGDTLAYIHTNKEETIKKAKENLKSAYEIKEKPANEYKHILKVI